MTANGRWARYYLTERGAPDRFVLAVTYHRAIRGRTRQLSISPRLMAKVLR